MYIPEYFRSYVKTLTYNYIEKNINIDDIKYCVLTNGKIRENGINQVYKIIYYLITSANPISYFDNAVGYNTRRGLCITDYVMTLNTPYGIIFSENDHYCFKYRCEGCGLHYKYNLYYEYFYPAMDDLFDTFPITTLCPVHMKHLVTFAEYKIYEIYINLYNKYILVKYFNGLDIDTTNYIFILIL